MTIYAAVHIGKHRTSTPLEGIESVVSAKMNWVFAPLSSLDNIANGMCMRVRVFTHGDSLTRRRLAVCDVRDPAQT